MSKKNKILVAASIFLAAVLVTGMVYMAVNSFSLEYTEGLEGPIQSQTYQNSVQLLDQSKADFRYDIRRVYTAQNKTRLIDHAGGYYLDFPVGTTFNFSNGECFVKAYGAYGKIVISREVSPYDDVVQYLADYYHRFIGTESYRKGNAIELNEEATRMMGKNEVIVLSMTRTPAEGSEIVNNHYSYCYILNKNSKVFHRVMFNLKEYDKGFIEEIMSSFTRIPEKGVPVNKIEYKPELPDWNEETLAVYNDLQNRTDVKWGVYVHSIFEGGKISKKISELEEKLDYKFSLVMGYTDLHLGVPVAALQDAYEDGKVVELTLQIANMDMANLDGKNPFFDAYDGKMDGEIRSFARQLTEFGHPVLFRLNNEMNTDWCSYSGVDLLCDADIYVAVWNRVYRIFEEEGVRNAIWIFNPQYGDYPPAKWNDYRAYFPGNDKVQLLGVTKYNTGDYYKERYSETWQDFTPAYLELKDLYEKKFKNYPWIITEFASSSYGGDKAAWIHEMFDNIHLIPEIKAAVWFNHGDKDNREGMEDIWARPYFIDETPETLQAFKDGLHGYVADKTKTAE